MNPEAVDAVVESIRRNLCPDVDPFIIFSAIEPQFKECFEQIFAAGFKRGMESAAKVLTKRATGHEKEFPDGQYYRWADLYVVVIELKHVSKLILKAADDLPKPEVKE